MVLFCVSMALMFRHLRNEENGISPSKAVAVVLASVGALDVDAAPQMLPGNLLNNSYKDYWLT